MADGLKGGRMRRILLLAFLSAAEALFAQQQPERQPTAIPQDLMAAMTEARYAVRLESGNLTPTVTNYANRVRARFGERGIEVEPLERSGSGALRLELAAWGREGRTIPVGAATRTASGNRIDYAHDGLTEWWVNSPSGLEQGFTIAEPRGDRSQPLVLELAAGSNWKPQMDGGDVVLAGSAGEQMRYAHLVVTDSSGTRVPAQLSASGEAITIKVRDEEAVYPITVDPVLTSQEAEVFGMSGQVDDGFGVSVAISGTTAVIGAYGENSGPGVNVGAVYVFVRSGTSWILQARLQTSDTPGAFGIAVGISGDTIVVGNSGFGVGPLFEIGAAYVFVRTGTTWSQQAKLMASDGAQIDQFGNAVGINGDTIVVAAIGKDTPVSGGGAAYVFVRTGATWSQQAELQSSDIAANDKFGEAIAVEGNTIVISADGDDNASGIDAGSAYVFVRSGVTWSQQAKLLPTVGVAGAEFGVSVGMSGNTVIVGARAAEIGGAAYVFVRSGTSWSQQAELQPSPAGSGDDFGRSVGISGDLAVVGASFADPPAAADAGIAYLYLRSGTTWSQQAQLTASDPQSNAFYGWFSAIDGVFAVVGAFQRSAGGAAYIYHIDLPNQPPATTADAVTAAEDTPLIFASSTLASNDSPGPASESGQTLTVTAVSATSTQGGTVSLSGGNITYTPPANYFGADSFTYTVTDNGTTDGSPDPQSANGTVNVTVTAVNDPPSATADAVTATEDTLLVFAASTLTGNDSRGPANESAQTLTVTAVSATSTHGGTVTLSGGNVNYTPPANYFGPDSFTYTVTDNGTTNGSPDPKSASGTVNVTVTEVNDAPATTPDAKSTAEDAPLVFAAATLATNDTTGPANESTQTLTVTAVAPTSTQGGTVSLSGGNITYAP